MDGLQGEDRSKKIREIEENLSELNQLIQSIKDDFPLMEITERIQMSRILQDYQVDTQKLEDHFRDAKNRGEFMGMSQIVLEDGSNSVKQLPFNKLGNELIELGNEILADLYEQTEKLRDLSPDGSKDDERTADKMFYSKKGRTAIIWIVIVLVFIIFLAVLLFLIL